MPLVFQYLIFLIKPSLELYIGKLGERTLFIRKIKTFILKFFPERETAAMLARTMRGEEAEGDEEGEYLGAKMTPIYFGGKFEFGRET